MTTQMKTPTGRHSIEMTPPVYEDIDMYLDHDMIPVRPQTRHGQAMHQSQRGKPSPRPVTRMMNRSGVSMGAGVVSEGKRFIKASQGVVRNEEKQRMKLLDILAPKHTRSRVFYQDQETMFQTIQELKKDKAALEVSLRQTKSLAARTEEQGRMKMKEIKLFLLQHGVDDQTLKTPPANVSARIVRNLRSQLLHLQEEVY